MADNELKYKIRIFAGDAIAEANRFWAAIKMGLSIDIGRRLIDGMLGATRAISGAIRDGVRFNSTLETARIGIAAVMRQFDPQRYATFGAAMADAGRALAYLTEKAKTSPATLESLVAGFQALSGPMAAAGIQMRQQVDLIVLMSQALSGLGIREEQLVQESRALVTGMINQNAAAAKILGITAEQIKAAREQGNLYGFLTERLAAFNEAAGLGAQTLQTRWSNLKDVASQTFGAATRRLFTQLKGVVEQTTQALESPGVRTGLQQIATIVGSAIGGLAKLAKVVAENAVVFSTLGAALGAVVAAHAAIKFGTLVAGVLAWTAGVRSGTAAANEKTAALAAERAALDANSAAYARNAAAAAAGGAARSGGGWLAGRRFSTMAGQDLVAGSKYALAGGASPATMAVAQAEALKRSIAKPGFWSVSAGGFGAALGRLAVWGAIAAMVGQAIAKSIEGWADAQQSRVLDGANAAAAAQGELRARMRGVSSVAERDEIAGDVRSRLEAARRRREEIAGKTAQTSFDRAEMETLSGDIRAYEAMLRALGGLTAEQIEQQQRRVAAEKAAAEAAAKAAQEAENRKANEAAADEAETSMARKRADAELENKLAGADPAARVRILRDEIKAVRGGLAAEGDLRGAQGLSPEEFEAKAARVQELNDRALQLESQLRSAQEAVAEARGREAEEARRAADAEREFRAEKQSPTERLREVSAELAGLAGKSDPASRLRRVELQRERDSLGAGMVADRDRARAEAAQRLARAGELRERMGGMLATRTGGADVSALFDRMYAGGTAGWNKQDEEMLRYQREMAGLMREIRDNTRGVR